MTDDKQSTSGISMSDEYRVLREELKINRQFIFERPLLIIGGALASKAMLGFTEPFSDLLIVFVILLLTFNLWFTMNRLTSSARIIGYIHLVHEGEFRENWKGWENSLSMYRDWCIENNDNAKKIRKDHIKRKRTDARRFYGPIFLFHILTIALVVITRLLTISLSKLNVQELIQFSMVLPVSTVALILALVHWRPQKIRNSIAAETEIWRKVLLPRNGQ